MLHDRSSIAQICISAIFYNQNFRGGVHPLIPLPQDSDQTSLAPLLLKISGYILGE